jgi:hypothetical protein
MIFALVSIDKMGKYGSIALTKEYVSELETLGIPRNAFEDFTGAVRATLESQSVGGFGKEMMKHERFRKNKRLRKLFNTAGFHRE